MTSLDPQQTHQYNPYNRVVVFLGLYFLIWSFVPAFISSSVALDVSEGINWGHEWQWGYYKHPPLSSWVLYSFYKVFGHFGPYLLSQLCVLLTLYLIYQLGSKVLSNTQAWLGTLLTLSIFYYTYPTLEFNHNIAQFPIWSGLSLIFYYCVTTNKYQHWILFGIVAGLGMLTKYSVAFLLLPMAIYLLLPQQWRLLKQPKPWLSIAVLFAVLSPHLLWLVQNNWLPFAYASGRSQQSSDGSQIVAHFSWLGFSLAQIASHLPLVIIILLLRKHLCFSSLFSAQSQGLSQLQIKSNTYWDDFKKTNFLRYLWLSPLLLLIVLGLVFGIGLRDLWGMPMWSLSGLVVASVIKPDSLKTVMSKAPKYVTVWLVFITMLMLTYLQFGHTIRDKPSRMDWSEQALSLEAQKTWDTLSTCQWDSLSGNRWLTALVAMNAELSPYATTDTWPSQMINGAAAKSPWMTASRLSKNGTLVIDFKDKSANLPLLDTVNDDNLVRYQGEWQIAWTKSSSAEPLAVSWQAYVPSHCIKQP